MQDVALLRALAMYVAVKVHHRAGHQAVIAVQAAPVYRVAARQATAQVQAAVAAVVAVVAAAVVAVVAAVVVVAAAVAVVAVHADKLLQSR